MKILVKYISKTTVPYAKGLAPMPRRQQGFSATDALTTATLSGVLADMGLPECEARAGDFAFRFSTVHCVFSFNNQARILAYFG